MSFIFMFVVISFVASCSSSGSNSGSRSNSNKDAYKIMFTDYDGTVLYSENVKKGEMPSYPLSEPTRKPDEDYTYSFSEWWPSIEKVTEDKIYTAYYTRTLKEEYTITFKNYDGTVLDTQIVKEGDKPVYLGDIPTKPHDDNNKYLFGGWSPSLTEATGDATYTANFIAGDLEKYMVIFAYEDNTVIKAYEVCEGDKPEYDGETPTMPNNEESKFKFRGWSPSITNVTEDTIYTAKFMALPLDYTVMMDPNGGESASGKKLEAFKTDNIQAKQFVYDLVKDNYKFAGWSYNNTLVFDEKGNTLVNLDEIEFDSSIVFVAEYVEEAYIKIDYVISAELNDKLIGIYDRLPEKYGEGSVSFYSGWNQATELNISLNSLYILDGWYVNDNLISDLEVFDYYLFNKDVSIEARIICPSYNIQISVNNGNNGQLMVQDYTNWCDSFKQTFYAGQEIIVAAKDIASRNFLGWYDWRGELVEEEYYFEFIAGDIRNNLTAKWDYFTIDYVDRDNTINNPNNPKYYTSNMADMTLLAPIKVPFGLAFEGWRDTNYHYLVTTIDCSKLENYSIYPSFVIDKDFPFDVTQPKTVYTAIIPSKVTSIDPSAFKDFDRMSTVLIPNTITYIGKDAFAGCTQLTNVYFDGTIDEWLAIEFENEKSNPMFYTSRIYLLDSKGNVSYNGKKYSLFTTYEMSKDTTSINKLAFAGCSSFETLYYDGTVEDWLNLEFDDALSNPMYYATYIYFIDENGTSEYNGNKYSILTTVEIPSTITTIGKYAFYSCNPLKTITLPSGITNIGESAFYGCDNLLTLYYDGTINNWCNITFENQYSNPMYHTSANYFIDADGIEVHDDKTYTYLSEIALPGSISKIKKYAFCNCKTITSLTFVNEAGVALAIEDYAFTGCTDLQSVYFSFYLNKIGTKAFADCTSLSSIRYNYSKAGWGTNVRKAEDWNLNVPANYVICTDGAVPLHS